MTNKLITLRTLSNDTKHETNSVYNDKHYIRAPLSSAYEIPDNTIKYTQDYCTVSSLPCLEVLLADVFTDFERFMSHDIPSGSKVISQKDFKEVLDKIIVGKKESTGIYEAVANILVNIKLPKIVSLKPYIGTIENIIDNINYKIAHTLYTCDPYRRISTNLQNNENGLRLVTQYPCEGWKGAKIAKKNYIIGFHEVISDYVNAENKSISNRFSGSGIKHSFALVTRPEYGTYIMFCTLFNIPMIPEVFELWVDVGTRDKVRTPKFVAQALEQVRLAIKDTGIPEIPMQGKDITTLIYPSYNELNMRDRIVQEELFSTDIKNYLKNKYNMLESPAVSNSPEIHF